MKQIKSSLLCRQDVDDETDEETDQAKKKKKTEKQKNSDKEEMDVDDETEEQDKEKTHSGVKRHRRRNKKRKTNTEQKEKENEQDDEHSHLITSSQKSPRHARKNKVPSTQTIKPSYMNAIRYAKAKKESLVLNYVYIGFELCLYWF